MVKNGGIRVRLTGQDDDRIRALAKAEGLTVSSFVRKQLGLATANYPRILDSMERMRVYIAAHPGCTIVDVEEATGLKRSTVEEYLRQLQRRGLIRREYCLFSVDGV